MRDLGRALASVVCFGVAAVAVHAENLNGFVRPQGHVDLAPSVTFESYDEFWVGETKVSDPGVGQVDTTSVTLWLAYGITDDLTLIANLPWVDADSDGLGGFGESDLQDLSIVGKYRFATLGQDVKSHFVGAFGVRTPASNYEDNLPVDVGDGTTDWLARFVYQLEIGAFYLSQQVGYDLRGDDAPNNVPLYTELGYTVGGATFNVGFAKLLAAGGTDIGDPGFTFPSNEEEYERLGAKVYYRINGRIGVAVAGFTTLDGRNTGDATGYSLGVNIGF